jgi:hypothetical protein
LKHLIALGALTLTLGLAVGCVNTPKCTASTCAGCCDANDVCQGGDTSAQCGRGAMMCSACAAGTSCQLGACVGGSGGSGGGSGGGTNTGGGNTGGGSATGGGNVSLVVVPPSATVVDDDTLLISAKVVGATNQAVSYTLESGPGAVNMMSDGSGVYLAVSGTPTASTASIRVTSVADPSVSIVVPISLTDYAVPFFEVIPTGPSFTPYAMALGSRQTFAVLVNVSGGATAGFSWFANPIGSVNTSGTFTAPSANGTTWVYARHDASNQWAWVEVDAQSTAFASVEISPAVTTVATHGVVQFTATVSTGDPVTWSVLACGQVSSTGTFTAPAQSGVCMVQASVSADRYAVATLVVQ